MRTLESESLGSGRAVNLEERSEWRAIGVGNPTSELRYSLRNESCSFRIAEPAAGNQEPPASYLLTQSDGAYVRLRDIEHIDIVLTGRGRAVLLDVEDSLLGHPRCRAQIFPRLEGSFRVVAGHPGRRDAGGVGGEVRMRTRCAMGVDLLTSLA